MNCTVCGTSTHRGHTLCHKHRPRGATPTGGGPRTTHTSSPRAAPPLPKNASAAAVAAARPIPMAVTAGNADALAYDALARFEDALVARAAGSGVTVELERQFVKYQKVKALALGAGSDLEARAALRFALIEAIKLVFGG